MPLEENVWQNKTYQILAFFSPKSFVIEVNLLFGINFYIQAKHKCETKKNKNKTLLKKKHDIATNETMCGKNHSKFVSQEVLGLVSCLW